MFKAALLSITLAAICTTASTAATAQTIPEHEALGFLIGEWETRSVFPDGSEVFGDLTYEWVLGGNWLRVEFNGHHPSRPVWGAQVMMRWDPNRSAYVSYVFTTETEPLAFDGEFLQNGTFRVSTANGSGTVGIDYTPTEDGVYQENWVIDSAGNRSITLRTTYRRQN